MEQRKEKVRNNKQYVTIPSPIPNIDFMQCKAMSTESPAA